eukprot:3522441-Pleurochrysis_carterae.AAC.1
MREPSCSRTRAICTGLPVLPSNAKRVVKVVPAPVGVQGATFQAQNAKVQSLKSANRKSATFNFQMCRVQKCNTLECNSSSLTIHENGRMRGAAN